MRMRRLHVDLNRIGSYADFYEFLKRELPLPPFFGNNLDALYDAVSAQVQLPLEIEFSNCNAFKKRAFSKLIRVLCILDKQIPDFHFKCREN